MPATPSTRESIAGEASPSASDVEAVVGPGTTTTCNKHHAGYRPQFVFKRKITLVDAGLLTRS